MKKIIFIAFAFISCSDIEQPDDFKSRQIVGCICNDGSIKTWRQDMIIEKNSITQFPCAMNGGIKEYIYK